MIGAGGVLLSLVLFALPAPAAAQEPKVELILGGVFTGAVPAGDVDATLIDPSGGTLTLFRTSNRIASSTGFEGLVSLRLWEWLRVEASAGWGGAYFESRVSGDFEGAPSESVRLRVHRFSSDLALVFRVASAGRWSLFVRAAGGGFRELTADRAFVENGTTGSLGAGMQLVIRDAGGGFFDRIAVRAEGRAMARRGGIEFGDDRNRVSPVVAAGLVFGR